MVELRWCTHFN